MTLPDSTRVNTYQISMNRSIEEWKPFPEELAELLDASINGFHALLARATDADIAFIPRDPEANDVAASNSGEPWAGLDHWP